MKIQIDDNGIEYFNRVCPYCKEDVRINRSNNKAVMFDNKVYHFECFSRMKQIHKKCKNCNKIFSFQNEEEINMLRYQNGFYCAECFKKLCDDGIVKKSKKWMNAHDNIEIYRKNARDNICEALKKKRNSASLISTMRDSLTSYAATIFAEYDVNNLIRANYNLQDVSVFYMRYLQPLYKGESKKYVSVKIPPVHLLEMWRTKLPYLTKLYQKQVAKGKEFSEVGRVVYDLSILVNKYEDFLEWKEKQRALEYEKTIIENTPINVKNIKPSVSAEGNNDVSEVLDDIFS
ncbi:hypothetical protein H8S37_03970 [Mediterraneibacter sp. NSJ-55]|uniref:Uncharacterized protein n=1 Tax=Mediterraneibacter hominis TaxID=2763054 RepID=A0A923LG48_9FIRM|nr:hypothetical protein [Mediterraneibacter hominis]MBC5688090.1 hypothetical protein [Mediterraneibacter hominis]